jgi:hypothetical protein
VPVLKLYNILRPVLIRKGADLPLLLIFAGRPPHRHERVRCPRAPRPPVRIGWSVVRKWPGRRWLPRIISPPESNPTPRAGQVPPKKRPIYGVQGER